MTQQNITPMTDTRFTEADVETLSRAYEPQSWEKIDKYRGDDDWNGGTAANLRHACLKRARATLRALTQTRVLVPAALLAELETARATIARYEGKLCLICGAKEPCALKDDVYSPCTFDPNPIEAAQKFHAAFQKARAQVAAMREALENLERFARAYARSPGLLHHERALWSAIHEAQRTLSPAAGDAP